MHKVGKTVFVSLEEIQEMKTNEKMLGHFVFLSSDWINASAYSYAKRYFYRSSLLEWKSWLTVGLWKAIQIADNRLKSVGGIYNLAWRDAKKAYVATYVNSAQKTEDACDACEKGEDGELQDIQIPSIDENLNDLPFNEYIERLRGQISDRDLYVVIHRLKNCDTLEEIGNDLGVTKEYVRQILKKTVQKMKEVEKLSFV